MSTVFVTHINHRHGHDVFVAATSEIAKMQVAEYCNTNWDVEDLPDPMPTDQDKLIEAYFDAVTSESYETAEYTVETI